MAHSRHIQVIAQILHCEIGSAGFKEPCIERRRALYTVGSPYLLRTGSIAIGVTFGMGVIDQVGIAVLEFGHGIAHGLHPEVSVGGVDSLDLHIGRRCHFRLRGRHGNVCAIRQLGSLHGMGLAHLHRHGHAVDDNTAGIAAHICDIMRNSLICHSDRVAANLGRLHRMIFYLGQTGLQIRAGTVGHGAVESGERRTAGIHTVVGIYGHGHQSPCRTLVTGGIGRRCGAGSHSAGEHHRVHTERIEILAAYGHHKVIGVVISENIHIGDGRRCFRHIDGIAGIAVEKSRSRGRGGGSRRHGAYVASSGGIAQRHALHVGSGIIAGFFDNPRIVAPFSRAVTQIAVGGGIDQTDSGIFGHGVGNHIGLSGGKEVKLRMNIGRTAILKHKGPQAAVAVDRIIPVVDTQILGRLRAVEPPRPVFIRTHRIVI